MSADEQLVERWQKGRDVSALNELRSRMRPIVQSQVNKYRANAVPTAVLDSEADKILVSSADKFNPRAGAAFTTYLFTNLRRLNRFSIARSNIATIPEARAQKIGVFQRAYERLLEQKRRPPTPSEIADDMSWPLSEVQTMMRSLRRDIAGSGLPGVARMDMQENRAQQLIHDIWYELTDDEKKVYGHLTGIHGHRKLLQGQQVSMATGFSQAKVSQLRKSIGAKMEKYL
jgi:DNA-directed RNA polymerase specialized sigma subunit